MPPHYSLCTDKKILAYFFKSRLDNMRIHLPESLRNSLADVYAGQIIASGGAHEFIMPYLELCITERCTLQCRQCKNFMPHYDNPKDYDYEEIIPPLEKFLKAVDYIAVFRILGGEPFLHKDLPQIVDYCGKHQKIGSLIVVTNGTIVPSDYCISKLKDNNTKIYISRYYTFKEIQNKIISRLKEENIPILMREDLQWHATGEGKTYPYSEKDVRNVFKNCNLICKTLVKNEFHLCPRSAHGMKLGIVPITHRDYIKILDTPVEEIRARILNIFNSEYVEACYTCPDPATNILVPAGEQLI